MCIVRLCVIEIMIISVLLSVMSTLKPANVVLLEIDQNPIALTSKSTENLRPVLLNCDPCKEYPRKK